MGTEPEEVDLFEHYTELPTDLCAIIDKYAYSDNTYETCESMLAEVKELGYTFDYDLDAQPYNLRKIGEENE